MGEEDGQNRGGILEAPNSTGAHWINTLNATDAPSAGLRWISGAGAALMAGFLGWQMRLIRRARQTAHALEEGADVQKSDT